MQERPVDFTAGGILFDEVMQVYLPQTAEEVAQVIQEHERVRVLGATHSLNPICKSEGVYISLEKMDRILSIKGNRCSFEAGVSVRQLCEELQKCELTLATVGSICEQNFVGAIATGTRGQVPHMGSLASQVCAIEFVDGKGELHQLSEEDEAFHGVVTSLGLCGVITKVTVRCIPLFMMAEVIRLLPIEEVITHMDELLSCEKLQMFWNVAHDKIKVVTGHRVDYPFKLGHFEMVGEYPHLHSIENFPDHIQRIGRSWEIISILRWSSERVAKKAREMHASGRAILQSDYAICQEDFAAFLAAMRDYFASRPNLPLAKDRMVLEMRPVKADSVWLSPAYERDAFSICFHDFERSFQWDEDAVEFKELENYLHKYSIRPHFGKAHFFTKKQLQRVFPKWDAFEKLCQDYDPEGCFSLSASSFGMNR
ncbi:MAG: FAD-binding protein [Chlamydiae bacterium]|nr:FAD-binding protein [Chlamydiota bacterium]